MFEQKEIFKRLKQTLNIEQDKELADFLGISPASFAVTKGRGTIPWEKIIEKSAGNYNLEYIFFGKGRTTPPKFDLESKPEDVDYEFLNLVSTYINPKMKEDLREKLLKIKELQ